MQGACHQRCRCVGLILVTVGAFTACRAYVTPRKTREIGIGMALGAEHADVLCLVIGAGCGQKRKVVMSPRRDFGRHRLPQLDRASGNRRFFGVEKCYHCYFSPRI
jgi:hypothetical protein